MLMPQAVISTEQAIYAETKTVAQKKTRKIPETLIDIEPGESVPPEESAFLANEDISPVKSHRMDGCVQTDDNP